MGFIAKPLGLVPDAPVLPPPPPPPAPPPQIQSPQQVTASSQAKDRARAATGASDLIATGPQGLTKPAKTTQGGLKSLIGE